MKIIVSRNHLHSKLRTMGRIVKQGKEVMYNSFMFDINGETLVVTGCDESGQISAPINCKIEEYEDMQFCIDVSILMNALKELPEQPLEIYVNNAKGAISLAYHNGKFDFVSTSAEQFPKMIPQKNAISVEIDSRLLYKGFQVGKFAANDELRPIMGNINLSSKDNHFAFAASNGNYLGVYEEDFADKIPDFDVNIPTKIAKIASDMLPQDDVKIPISFDDRSIRLTLGDYTIAYRLHEGKYPNYHSIIPTNNNTIVKVDCSDLIAAISRVSVFSDEHSSAIVLDLKESNLDLTAENTDCRRSAKESIMLDQVYPEFKIGFKSQYLTDILKTIDTEICEIHVSTPSRATLFKPFESDYATYLLMPMMVNN